MPSGARRAMTLRPPDRERSLPEDPLDEVLRGWRRRQDATVDSAALASRLVAAIRSDGGLAVSTAARGSRRPWAERTLWFAAGIAVAVALVLVARPLFHLDDTTNWPPSVRFAADQLDEKAALVSGMDETFAGSLAWIAEHDGRVDVGLVAGPSKGGDDALVVRIVVLSRRVGDAAWREVWQSDVVTRDEQVVDLPAGPTGEGRMRLWTHPLPDGAIAVDGELALAGPAAPIRASYGGVQRPGEPRRVTGHRANGVEWQVIQNVVPLPTASKEVG